MRVSQERISGEVCWSFHQDGLFIPDGNACMVYLRASDKERELWNILSIYILSGRIDSIESCRYIPSSSGFKLTGNGSVSIAGYINRSGKFIKR